MVSIFGLKLGGEKKKRSEKTIEKNTIRRKPDETRFGDEPFGADSNHDNSDARSVRSTARPSSSRSLRFKKPKGTPYLPESQGQAAKSLTDLGANKRKSAFFGLEPVPALATRFRNGSSTSLATTSKASTQDHSDTFDSKLLVPAPRISSLAKYELQLNLPDDDLSFFGDMVDQLASPEPLRIVKQKASSPELRPKTEGFPTNPPSPPRSISTLDQSRLPSLEQPIAAPASDVRPATSSGQVSIPTGLNTNKDTDSVLSFDLSSVPSPPPSLPRASDDSPSTGWLEQSWEPVIQNVRAKRDTLTISAPRRRSLEMRVEEFGRFNGAGGATSAVMRSKTARADRPPPLNLGPRPMSPDRMAPRSAPFAMAPRIASPLTQSMRQPSPSVPKPRPRHDMQTSMFDDEEDQSNYGSDDDENILFGVPDSPESPVIPLSGPLASPRMAPPPDTIEQQIQQQPQQQPQPKPRTRLPNPEFRFPDWSGSTSMSASRSLASPPLSTTSSSFSSSHAPAGPPPPLQNIDIKPLIGARPPLTPDSLDCWPLPSPAQAPPAGLTFPPLEPPPRISAIRPESPFGRTSFSRPWTPTNPMPLSPMKSAFDDVPRGAPPAVPKRAETRRGPPRGPPPPRSVAIVAADKSVRVPTPIGDDMGGFI